MQGRRDNGETELFLGLCLPAAVLLWLLFDFYAGCIYLPGPKGQRLPFQATTDSALYWGVVAIKLGGSMALFNWYWLANRPQFDNYVPGVQIAAVCIFVAGLFALVGYILCGLLEVFGLA